MYDRDNVEDALEKLQSYLDRAAESLVPVAPDPEKAKEMAKRQVLTRTLSSTPGLRQNIIDWCVPLCRKKVANEIRIQDNEDKV